MTRFFLRRSLPLFALVVAGAVVLVVGGDGTVPFVIGFILIGIAAVLMVSLFFYEVGRSEDRARAAERRRRWRANPKA